MAFFVETTNLDWCPTFTYCEQCHAGKNKDAQGRKTKYVKAHCAKNGRLKNGKPGTCTKVETGVCLKCEEKKETLEEVC